MPNYCYYEMRVRGKRENIEEFVKVMTDYERPKHFWRVFSAYTDYDEPDENGLTTAMISGDCAWSVHCCMCIGPCTYAGDADEEYRTSLQDESKRLQLEIEVYSDEPGMAFQEHYHYDKGEELEAECVDCCHYWFEEIDGESEQDRLKRFEEFKCEYDLPPRLTLDDFDDNCEYVSGGFGEWDFLF